MRAVDEIDLDRDRERAGLRVPPRVRGRGAARDRPGGLANAGARNGSSASSVTTHGEIVVAKFFARNGPSGWYSQAWMSRADQSFTRQKPKICSSARSIGTGSPSGLPPAHEAAQLHLVVERAGWGRSSALRASGGLALARRAAAPACRSARSTRRGRGSRSAPTCSWAAADCRGGTCCRRWWRGGPRRRSRCSRRSPRAGAARRRAGRRGCGRRAGGSTRYAGESAPSSALTWRRSSDPARRRRAA